MIENTESKNPPGVTRCTCTPGPLEGQRLDDETNYHQPTCARAEAAMRVMLCDRALWDFDETRKGHNR